MRTLFLIPIFVALVAVAPQPVVAQQTVSRTVSHADLDLSTTQGRAILDRRIAHAVRDLCGDASDTDLAGKNEVRRCRDDAWAIASLKRRVATASTAPSASQ